MYRPNIRNVGPGRKSIARLIAEKVAYSYIKDPPVALLAAAAGSMPPIRPAKRKRVALKKAKSTIILKRNSNLNRRQELKCFDVGYSNSPFSGAGTFTVLNSVVNGAELYQRDGRQIYMKSIHIRGYIYYTSAVSVSDINRVLLVLDNQPNAALPTNVDILSNSNAGAAFSNLASANMANRNRFRIIRDHLVPVAPATVAAGQFTTTALNMDQSPGGFNINWFVKLWGAEVNYNGTNGATIADINTGSLLLVTICGNNASTMQLAFSSRLRYYD